MQASKKNNNLYNKALKENAHDLRSSMTKAEACLWKYALRAGQMNGYKFRRQRPVLKYIADFMCIELKLIIEVDGYSHLLEEVSAKDKVKQDALERAGFTILRFNDADVLNEIKRVRQIIWDKMEELEKSTLPKI